jgi:hypothetical protein
MQCDRRITAAPAVGSSASGVSCGVAQVQTGRYMEKQCWALPWAVGPAASDLGHEARLRPLRAVQLFQLG